VNYFDGVAKISKVLRFEWNPIGMSELPEDEYASYAPEIFGMLKRGAEDVVIAERLAALEEGIWGRRGDPEDLLAVARALQLVDLE
jgi:hypothetical protein